LNRSVAGRTVRINRQRLPAGHGTGICRNVASFEKLLLALFAFGFCPSLQKRYDIDQRLNRQEVIVFAHCS
jgi:hypothetical protein